ncbi:MAG: MFS transporter [Chloroflexota bacterium]|nr:MFS transporter [Chloroflexota bacterium]MDE2884103.1 MFS transporter [Chloroflexota bacterium]
MADPPDRRAEAAEPAPAAGRVRPWGSFAYADFRWVLISFVVGFMGFQIRQVTNLWVIWDLTGSPLSLGLLGVFQFAPMLILVFIGGSLADIVDRRTLLILTQSGNFLLAGVLAMLMLTDNIAVWHIYTTTLVTSAVNTFEGPARMAMLPRLVPRTHMMNAITMNQAARHASMLIGPAIGGLLIGLVGPGWTYAAVFVVFIPTVGMLLLVSPMPPDASAGRRRMDVRSMLAGFRFIFGTHVILVMMLLDIVAMLFTHHRGLVPVFWEILDAGSFGYGLLFAAPAAGFLVGSALLLLLGDVKYKGAMVMGSYAAYLASIVMFAMSTNFLLSLAALALVGATDGIGAIMRSTIVQMAVPDDIRGRTTAVLQLSNRGGPSLGQVTVGAMAAAILAPNALLVGAAIGTATLVIALFAMRDLLRYQG